MVSINIINRTSRKKVAPQLSILTKAIESILEKNWVGLLWQMGKA